MDDLNFNAETSAPSIETASVSSSPTPDIQPTEIDLDASWNRAVNPPQEQSATTPEPVTETARVETEEAEDILKEFETDVIPDDEILKDKIIRHVPKAERDNVLKAFTDARAFKEMEAKLGGKSALPILEQVSTAIFTPEVTQPSTAQFLMTIEQSNPSLLDSIGETLFAGIMSMDDPKWQAVVDNHLQAKFGISSEKIAEVSKWMQAGLFDEEFIRQEYESEGFTNPKVAELLEENKRLKEQTAQQTQQQTKKVEFENELKQKRLEISNQYVLDSVLTEINPIIEKLAWATNENDPPEWGEAKGVLGEMREAWIKQKIESSPYAKNIKYLLDNNQAFDANGNPTQSYKMQLERIQGIVKSSVISAGRKLQPTFTKSLLSSRNAQITSNPLTQPSPSQPRNEVPSVQSPSTNGVTTQAELDALWMQLNTSNANDTQTRQRLANGR